MWLEYLEQKSKESLWRDRKYPSADTFFWDSLHLFRWQQGESVSESLSKEG